MPGVALAPEEIYDPLRKAADAPAPGYLEQVGASFRTGKDDIGFVQDDRLLRAYQPLMDALYDATGKRPSSYMTIGSTARALLPFSGPMDQYDRDAMWQDIAKYGIKVNAANRAEFEKSVLTRNGARARDQRALSRGDSFTAQAIGGLGSSVFDPTNMVPVGGTSKTIAQAVWRNAVLNAAITAAQQVPLVSSRERMGEQLTAQEAATNVGIGALFGGVLGGAGKIGADNWDAIKVAPKDLQEKIWTKIVDKSPALQKRLGSKIDWDALDDALPDLAEAMIGRENMSGAELDALRVLQREADVDAANPYRADGAGTARHRSDLQKATERLLALTEGRPVNAVAAMPGEPSVRAAARSSTSLTVPGRKGQIGYANDIYSFFKGKGLSDAQARGIAAGIHAESASNHNVRGGYKGRAVGIGQWLGPRRAELLRRYGPTPSRKQQLEFLWEELQGRDPGGPKVLAKADEAEVLRSYIVDFMRPAKGSQTTGDLSRGMQALGRGGETISIEDAPNARVVDRAPEVDPELAIREQLTREADAIDAERTALVERAGDVMPDRTDVTSAPMPDFEIASLPELRRELFPDDTSWKIAQAEVDAEEMGLPQPLVTRQTVWEDAAADLQKAQDGEARGALYRNDIGPIDVAWGVAPAKGQRGFGLARIATKFPEVLNDLPAIIEQMDVTARTDNRIQLASLDRNEKVQLDWDAQKQQWQLTSYDMKKAASPSGSASDVPDIAVQDGAVGRGMMQDIAQGPAQGKLDFQEPPSVMRPDDAALLDFDDPVGAGAVAQVDSLAHDLKAMADSGRGATEVRMDAEGASETLDQLMQRLADEEAVIATIRGCL